MGKILIVDDVGLNRNFLSEIFRNDYDIVEAKNGREAIDFLKKENNIKAVLLDLQMPQVDGFAVLEFTKTSPRYDRIPVVVNTVHGEDENEIRALNMGADDFIFKPFNAKLIRIRVENAIKNKEILAEKLSIMDTMKQEIHVIEAVRKFIPTAKFDEAAEMVLKKLLENYKADRSYIFEIDMEQNVMSNTYQYCAHHVISTRNKFQNIPIERYKYFLDQLDTLNYFNIRDIHLIKDNDLKLFEDLRNAEIDALMMVPIYLDNKLYGFMGIDNYGHFLEDAHFLITMTALVTNEIIRKRNEQENRKSVEYYQTVVHNIRYRNIMDRSVIASFLFNLTNNQCGEGYSGKQTFLKLQGTGTIEGFFNLFYENIIDQETKEECKRVLDQKNLIQNYYNGKSRISIQHKYLVETGKVWWVDTTIDMVKNPMSGDIEGFLYIKDVNEQVLRKELIDTIVNTQFDYIVQIDQTSNSYTTFMEKLEIQRFVERNGSSFDLTHFEFVRDIILAENKEEIIQNSAASQIADILSREGEYGYLYSIVDRNARKRRKKVYFEFTNQDKMQLCMVCKDVTDVYEEEQHKNSVLKDALGLARQANHAKTKFLSSMSHDIRTPLNAIIGMTELARMDQEDHKKIEERLSVIHSSSQHLLDLVNDVLDFSKLESGSKSIINDAIYIPDELEKLNNIVMPMFTKKDQQFLIQTKNIIHPYLKGDALRLNRVLINLLNNASKFTHKGGKIEFLVEEMEAMNKNLAKLRITVKDNGIGIAKENQPYIFESFYREPSPDIGKIEGTGLGLSIAKSILEERGGTIQVVSERGNGCSFIIEEQFQIDQSKSNEKEARIKGSVTEKIDFSGLQILLVEDHPINAFIAKEIMEKFGAVVTHVSNGELGVLEFIKSHADYYDFIFMDIQMPVLNGYEATKVIRHSSHKRAGVIPIIAMTANTFEDDIKKCLDSGMDGHIGKPININLINQVIQRFRK